MLHPDQLPDTSALIKTQHISLVWHIPACLLQKHIIFALMQKKSTIRITRINGEVTEEKEVDKEIIQEAVPEIIVKGTQ